MQVSLPTNNNLDYTKLLPWLERVPRHSTLWVHEQNLQIESFLAPMIHSVICPALEKCGGGGELISEITWAASPSKMTSLRPSSLQNKTAIKAASPSKIDSLLC
jgi:hypothetical protein